ncbi:MAG: sigma-70 family RNA polymerase sigma factor [Polyangia bacterium]|jgi:RNA polymerase sigma-70 factor (ECF subfamily)
MPTAQEISNFRPERAEMPHQAVAIAPTRARTVAPPAWVTDQEAAPHLGQERSVQAALVEQARAGNREALDQLLAILRPRAIAVAMKVLRNDQDAEDAVQEAFVKLWRSLHAFAGRSSFSTWVHRIVMNSSLDLLRRSGSRCASRAADCSQEASAPEPASPHTPESDLAEDEVKWMVRSAIARLPVLHRQAVELREIESCSYQEMADIIQCPIGTVMSRLHHARHRLAADLGQPLDDAAALAAA